MGDPFALCVGIQTGTTTEEIRMEIDQKIKNGPPLDPVIPLLGEYTMETKTLIPKNISTPMFIAVFCTITKIWKQPKCPSTDEWIKQLWDVYPTVYYSTI